MDTPVVVVTGAGAGIGRAIAEAHVRAGWLVIAVERNPAALEALDIPRVTAVVGDVADKDVLSEARGQAAARGTLFAWVNNAASAETRPLLEVDDEHIEAILRTNVGAVVSGTRLAVDEFVRAGTRGSIVNISSVHARLSFAGHTMYDASKSAVEGLCRVVAAEFGHLGIRCNAVAPGAVMTEREVEARRLNPPQIEPIPRAMFSTPADIANVVAFLTNTGSEAINGAVIPADRGLSIAFLDQHWHSGDSHG